jgi:hypothetical protein
MRGERPERPAFLTFWRVGRSRPVLTALLVVVMGWQSALPNNIAKAIS